MLKKKNKNLLPPFHLPLETTGIYQINYRRELGGTKAYIGKTKRKIKEHAAEHKRDIK